MANPRNLPASPDLGLLFLRVAGALMLFFVHGLPKAMDYTGQLAQIEDPFGLGPHLSLWAALFAEVVCPVFIALGWHARLACLPIIVVLAIAMLFVHFGWSLEQGQFGWLLLIIFITIALCGPGRWRIGKALGEA
ncbi:MAG TPA: DoxX family protein [Bordetella sp.]